MSGFFSAGVVPPPPPTVIITGVSFSAAGRLPHTALIYGGLLLTQYARATAPSGATSTPRTPNATILT